MESKKIQWNKLLNSLIICVSVIMACLFIGFCFVVPTPKNNVKALTKQDIVNAYNIHFTAAKTDIRTATNYNKVRLYDRNDNFFYTYEYNYNSLSSTKMYYSSNGNYLEDYSSNSNGYVSLESPSTKLTTYTEVGIDSRFNSDYIAHNATHYDNGGYLKEILYDEFDNNDFVMLNNFNSHTSTSTPSFNVENLYLSFGTEYNNEKYSTTPLYNLSVSARLTNTDGETYLLSLNPVHQVAEDTKGADFVVAGSKINYWYQYLDLRTLYGISEDNTKQFAIDNQEGKIIEY